MHFLKSKFESNLHLINFKIEIRKKKITEIDQWKSRWATMKRQYFYRIENNVKRKNPIYEQLDLFLRSYAYLNLHTNRRMSVQNSSDDSTTASQFQSIQPHSMVNILSALCTFAKVTVDTNPFCFAASKSRGQLNFDRRLGW